MTLLNTLWNNVLFSMQLLELLLAALLLTLPSIFAIDGKLPIINDVIKHTEGYSYSATIKFTYSYTLTALYNKIDIFTCNFDTSTGAASHCQLASTIDAILDTEYSPVLDGLSPGNICFKVCGRSSYRSAKKCSKLFSLDNSIKRKVIPSASKHKALYNKQAYNLPVPHTTPTSLLAHVSGYDLAVSWKYLHHIKPEFSLGIRLLAAVDRQLVFPNGAKECVLQAGVTYTSVRLPYSHFKYESIQVTLCSLLASDSDARYDEKTCSIPLVIPNDVMLYNREAGVMGINVDRGIARVTLNRAVSKHTERVYVECTWFDTRDESSVEQALKQEINIGNQQLWSISVRGLELHSAYSCLIHLVRGNTYRLFADKPFVFDTPDL